MASPNDPTGRGYAYRHLSDQDVLNQAAVALRDAYEDSHVGDPPRTAAAEALAEVLSRGITVRQVASHARLPGRWLISWVRDPAARATAYRAEIHHLERELTAVRRDRARDVYFLTRRETPPQPGQLSKTAAAETFDVSRPTIDAWIADALHSQTT